MVLPSTVSTYLFASDEKPDVGEENTLARFLTYKRTDEIPNVTGRDVTDGVSLGLNVDHIEA